LAGWIGRSWSKGIVTSEYPARAPDGEEMPASGLPPSAPADPPPGPTLDVGARLCPTDAIRPEGIHQGRCIRCSRCQVAGLRFEGTGEVVAASPGALLWPLGRPPDQHPTVAGLEGIRRSVHIFMMDVGSCQACNLEVLSLANPYYDAHRLGIAFTNSPRHADVLLVVGVPTTSLVEPLRRTYEAMPGPKAVIAVGACALDGGIFRGGPAAAGEVRSVVPVDLFVPGCPPPPVAILNGLLTLLGRQRGTEGAPK
jgi:formate hydrogenlyase subunit 7